MWSPRDSRLAKATRIRLWSEHLGVDPGALADEDPEGVVDARFKPIAAEQLARAQRGAPPAHRLIELPGVSRRSRRLLGPLVGLVDDS
jgi:hypothetical protein